MVYRVHSGMPLLLLLVSRPGPLFGEDLRHIGSPGFGALGLGLSPGPLPLGLFCYYLLVCLPHRTVSSPGTQLCPMCLWEPSDAGWAHRELVPGVRCVEFWNFLPYLTSSFSDQGGLPAAPREDFHHGPRPQFLPPLGLPAFRCLRATSGLRRRHGRCGLVHLLAPSGQSLSQVTRLLFLPCLGQLTMGTTKPFPQVRIKLIESS